MKKVISAALLLVFFCAAPLSAGEWKVDDRHSQAVFTIEHIVGQVTGFFKEFHFPDKKMKSSISFDPEKPEQASFDLVINTWSIDTGIERRDKHLSTSDFFDCRKFPVITFKSDKVTILEDGTYEARGELTIKDVTKTVSVPFNFLGSEKHPTMDTRKGALEARFNLDRLEYNVGAGKFKELGLVGDNVCLTIYLEMFPKE
jgi:polyisoprenoid-binding protein YceI